MVKKIINKIQEVSKEDIKNTAKANFDKHISFLLRVESFLYEPPIIKVPLVFVLFLVFELLFSASFNPDAIYLGILRFIGSLLFTIYFVFFIVHLVKRSFKKLMSAKNIWMLFIGYALFMLSIILVFASLYDFVDRTEIGYIKYGSCSDNFNPDQISSDPNISSNYFYFSSITLFTVGYGDICPMGAARTVSMLNAFVGNFINVVLMVWVISNFMKRQENKDNE